MPYSDGNLLKAISNDNYQGNLEEDHVRYLHGYLTTLGCHKIAVEESYVDKDYLDDYANYYSKCFRHYERFCKRLHFFKALDDARFLRLMSGDNDPEYLNRLQEDYLGFVVVKPLPDTVIGRTILRPYPDSTRDGPDRPGLRSIRSLRDYESHLCGLELNVASLPFQQQDRVTSACATSAIWSALQYTAARFGYNIPTPFEITKAATKHYQLGRPFPSSGLTREQMCQALIENGLEPDVVQYKKQGLREGASSTEFLEISYAYLRAGLPIILGVEIEGKGGHAVALAGYRLDETGKGVIENSDPRMNFKGASITKLYAHDDAFGPFAWMKVVSEPGSGTLYFETSWKMPNGTPRRVDPTFLMVPVYRKIRVPFLAPFKYLFEIQALLFATHILQGEHKSLIWDGYLSNTCEYKQEIREREMRLTLKSRLLESHMPRFFWRYRGFYHGQEVIEVLADATDFELSCQLFRVNYIDEELEGLMLDVLQRYGSKEFSSPILLPMLHQDDGAP